MTIKEKVLRNVRIAINFCVNCKCCYYIIKLRRASGDLALRFYNGAHSTMFVKLIRIIATIL